MNNTQKDRFEKKLIRFIRELDSEWNSYRKKNNIIMTVDMWKKHRDEVYKKYGFTDEEWNKASRLIRSRSWAGKHLEQKKILRDKNHDVYKSDIADNLNGEVEIKAEDRWIADVFDTYDYDKEDMSR